MLSRVFLFKRRNLKCDKIFKAGEMNKKECFDDFVVGFCFRGGRVPP